MQDLIVQITVLAEDRGAIIAARADHNRMVQMRDGPNATTIDTDEAFFPILVERMMAEHIGRYGRAYRLPTGEWLQRWTVEEKKATRLAGQTNAQIQAWLDELDASPTVNLYHDSVQVGVPQVCAMLEAQGVIAAGEGQTRAAAIMALNLN